MNKESEKITWRECFTSTKRACRIWWDNYPEVLISIVLNAMATALFPYIDIYLSARIINELAGSRNPEVLKKLVLLTIVLNAVLALGKAASERWKNYCQEGIWLKTKKIYSNKVLSMDFEKIDQAKTHELLATVVQYQNWSGFGLIKIYRCMDELLQHLFQIIGAVALTVTLFTSRIPNGAGIIEILNSPFFAALLILLMVGVIVAVPALRNKGNEFWTRMGDSTQVNRLCAFYGAQIIDKKRALDVRMYEQDKTAKGKVAMDKTFHSDGPVARGMRGKYGLLLASSEGISYVLTGIIYLFVCLKAWGGAFGVGSITQYVGATTAMAKGAAGFLEVLGKLKLNTSFLQTLFEFLDIPNEMYQGTLTVEKRNDRNYEVEFKDVSFKYPGTDAWALRHVNMKFKVGERLAIVGQNGSGKTTFIKLLCRLYDPTEGEILLNGIDIRKYNYKEYMSVFSVVFQDFQLLALPLGENVAVGQHPDRGRAEKKLKDAGFESLTEKMPKGLDTYIYKKFDEEGVDVSGGEAQKIAIARALYKDAPFIILDEPTAALDPIAEAEIYSKFNDIVEDKTAIYISHRLSSCKFCDEIAVFDAGSVIQQGSHEKLVAEEDGKYYELWNAQAQYYA